MGITKLITADRLRFERISDSVVIADFSLLDNDEVDTNITDNDLDVVVPVYGSPYAILANPAGSKHTKGSVTLRGTKAAFEALDIVASLGGLAKLRLVMGGTNIPEVIFIESCVITNLSYTTNVLKNGNTLLGTVAYINLT